MKSKSSVAKIIFCVVFAVAVFGAYAYVLAKGDYHPEYFSFGAVCACLLLSLIFLRFDRFAFISLSIAAVCVANYFLVFMPSYDPMIWLGLLCGSQVLFALYTICLAKSSGFKIINFAIRVAVCLIIYFILPLYFDIALFNLIFLMYLANLLLSVLFCLLHIKTQWILLLGLLALLVSEAYVMLAGGGLELFGISGGFAEFISSVNLSQYCLIPALFVISFGSVCKLGSKEAETDA